MDLKKQYIVDIETYPNVFTLAWMRCDGGKSGLIEIGQRKNEKELLLQFLDHLHNNNCYMVGFNSLGFDYPVLHKILRERAKLPTKGLTLSKWIYRVAQNQIDSFRKSEGFGNTIKEADWWFGNIDLYKIHHFDNKAKATSLKMLEFNMRKDNISDLPYPVGTFLTDEQIDVLCKYNKHDVQCTYDFYNYSLNQIRFRFQLTEKYNRNFINHNDTKIGKDYFIMRLEESGIPTRYTDSDGKSHIIQSKRAFVDIRDCILDYYDFERPEFLAILNWFKQQRITETKGVFTDIVEHKLGDVAKFANLTTKKVRFKAKPTNEDILEWKKEYPLGWIEEEELEATENLLDEHGNVVREEVVDSKGKKKLRNVKINKKSYWGCYRIAETLNVVVDGFQFDFGTGGIHGSVLNKDGCGNEKYTIIDADVSSFYPNLAIVNRIYPEHLTEKFCDIYEDMYVQRKTFGKGTTENAMLKLALNGTYGDSNNKYSPFYDWKYTVTITVNGQLSLCLLAEKLLKIKGLKIIQCNTDGITCAVPRVKESEYYKICDDWQKQVKLELEYAIYSRMIIRDVNNYIALYENGKVKRKGAYQYEDLGWHQNQGGLVIQKAVEANLLKGIPVEVFIKEHLMPDENKWDFCLRVKVPRSSSLVLCDGIGEEPQQNICRYYASKSGGKLVKIMPPLEEGGEERRLSIDSEWNVLTCNDISDFDKDKVDIDYYVSEANKLISFS